MVEVFPVNIAADDFGNQNSKTNIDDVCVDVILWPDDGATGEYSGSVGRQISADGRC